MPSSYKKALKRILVHFSKIKSLLEKSKDCAFSIENANNNLTLFCFIDGQLDKVGMVETLVKMEINKLEAKNDNDREPDDAA